MSGVEKRIAGLLVVGKGIVRTRNRFSVSWPDPSPRGPDSPGRPKDSPPAVQEREATATQMFDIAIIGAGPAGATLARLIGKEVRVLLVDKRPFCDAARSFSAGKCCGGLLAPDAQRMLSEFGLGLPRNVLEGPQLFVVKAIDIQQGSSGIINGTM